VDFTVAIKKADLNNIKPALSLNLRRENRSIFGTILHYLAFELNAGKLIAKNRTPKTATTSVTEASIFHLTEHNSIGHMYCLTPN
jgi:hypothetical protein